MQDSHSTYLGRRTLPRDLSAVEIEAVGNFSDAERRVIENRRGPALKLALALQIGVLRMTGGLLEAVRCSRFLLIRDKFADRRLSVRARSSWNG